MTIPNIATFDHGTHEKWHFRIISIHGRYFSFNGIRPSYSFYNCWSGSLENLDVDMSEALCCTIAISSKLYAIQSWTTTWNFNPRSRKYNDFHDIDKFSVLVEISEMVHLGPFIDRTQILGPFCERTQILGPLEYWGRFSPRILEIIGYFPVSGSFCDLSLGFCVCSLWRNFDPPKFGEFLEQHVPTIDWKTSIKVHKSCKKTSILTITWISDISSGLTHLGKKKEVKASKDHESRIVYPGIVDSNGKNIAVRKSKPFNICARV